MLVPMHLRDLLVDPASHPRGQPHLSAASGLVAAGNWLYLVADDEHHLGLLDASGDQAKPLRLHRVMPSDLPQNKAERKKLKPDLEALSYWPLATGQPGLLALGSGSRPRRERALLVPLDSGGVPADIREISLAELYEPLHAEFADLNIEGAFVTDGRLRLLQRGNKGDGRNASIDFPLAPMQQWLAGQRSAPPSALLIREFALGHIDGIPLGFTDGTPLPDGGWLFSAVAENTDNSYSDGACAGSAIGWVNKAGQLVRLEPLAGSPKVEGIAHAAGSRLLMVTDSDDPATPSALLSVGLE